MLYAAEADEETETIALYSDYVCPFCYLGRASLERYADERDEPLAVEWRPFDLRGYKRGSDGEIDHAVDDGKDDDYFAQVRENVERLKEEYDAEMTLDYSLDVDSWDAQKAALAVRESDPESFPAFDDALYDALWRDGRDIGDPDVLADVAEAVGVDGDVVRSAVADDALDERLRERFEAARDAGVTGIPTFASDGHAARGAVPPAQLRRLVEGA